MKTCTSPPLSPFGYLAAEQAPFWSYGTKDDVVQRQEHSAALLQDLSRAMATALTAWMRDPWTQLWTEPCRPSGEWLQTASSNICRSSTQPASLLAEHMLDAVPLVQTAPGITYSESPCGQQCKSSLKTLSGQPNVLEAPHFCVWLQGEARLVGAALPQEHADRLELGAECCKVQ